jgi:hypothetical protein
MVVTLGYYVLTMIYDGYIYTVYICNKLDAILARNMSMICLPYLK